MIKGGDTMNLYLREIHDEDKRELLEMVDEIENDVIEDKYEGFRNIKGLTAGDFVTVKRKADFLCVDNLDEIRRMLTEEVKLKKCSDLKNTIGFTL